MEMENTNYKTHVGYIIFILIAIIILLVAVEWGKIEKLVEYITFALTLTSLVLALLAIVYAVFSNSKFVQNITTLTNISDEVKRNSFELKSATDDLKSKIEAIPDSLKDVEKNTSKTNELLEKLSQSPISDDLIGNKINKGENLETITIDELLTDIITNSSFLGKLLLYASYLSLTKKESFSLDDLFQENKDYAFGFLSVLTSLGIILYTTKKDIYTVSHVSQKILDEISDEVMKIAKEHDEKEIISEDNDSWVKNIIRIKDYFEED